MAALNRLEIAAALAVLPKWKLSSGSLVREWHMDSFEQAISFVNQVAELSQAAGHHPDIEIRSALVRLSLVSHDTGALTSRDVSLATAISRAFPS